MIAGLAKNKVRSHEMYQCHPHHHMLLWFTYSFATRHADQSFGSMFLNICLSIIRLDNDAITVDWEASERSLEENKYPSVA